MTPKILNNDTAPRRKRTLSDLNRKQFQILSLIPQTAKENGICAEFMETGTGLRNPGLYFIVTPDKEIMDSLKRNILWFDELVDNEKNRNTHMTNCYCSIVDLSDLSESNVFLKHQQMCKAVQDMAIAVNAFFEYGYPLPRQIHEQTIENFYDYNTRRYDKALPKRLRDSYDDIMAKAVTDAYQLYSKQEALSLLPVRKKDDINKKSRSNCPVQSGNPYINDKCLNPRNTTYVSR